MVRLTYDFYGYESGNAVMKLDLNLSLKVDVEILSGHVCLNLLDVNPKFEPVNWFLMDEIGILMCELLLPRYPFQLHSYSEYPLVRGALLAAFLAW